MSCAVRPANPAERVSGSRPRNLSAGRAFNGKALHAKARGASCGALAVALVSRQPAIGPQARARETRYVLNCQPVGAITPATGVTFAMVVEVPASAEPGRYLLLWALDEGLSTRGFRKYRSPSSREAFLRHAVSGQTSN